MDHQISNLISQAKINLPPLRGIGSIGLENTNPDQGGKMLAKVLSNVIGVLTLVAALWFLIQIVIAGYNFITSQGDSQKIQQTQQRIINSIIGLALVVFSVGFLSLIGHLLQIDFLQIDQIITNLSL